MGPVDRCALNLSRKHQPKPNLHTEVRRNGTEVLEMCTDEYQTLVQGLIKGCREWYRPRKRGESVVLFIEVLGTKSKYLSLDLSEPEQTGKLVERNESVDANGTLAVQVFRLDLSERG
jgi:hypothetical protein